MLFSELFQLLKCHNHKECKQASLLLLANLHFKPKHSYDTYHQVSHTDRQILILERVIVSVACSNTCLDIYHWPLLCDFGRGGEWEKDLIFCPKNFKYNMCLVKLGRRLFWELLKNT